MQEDTVTIKQSAIPKIKDHITSSILNKEAIRTTSDRGGGSKFSFFGLNSCNGVFLLFVAVVVSRFFFCFWWKTHMQFLNELTHV